MKAIVQNKTVQEIELLHFYQFKKEEVVQRDNNLLHSQVCVKLRPRKLWRPLWSVLISFEKLFTQTRNLVVKEDSDNIVAGRINVISIVQTCQVWNRPEWQDPYIRHNVHFWERLAYQIYNLLVLPRRWCWHDCHWVWSGDHKGSWTFLDCLYIFV